MRQSIRGYTDAQIEEVTEAGTVEATAAELSAFRDLLDRADDLRRVLTDPGVVASARRNLLVDLLGSRVGSPTLRLLRYCIESDRATEFIDDVAWLVLRVDAAARRLEPVEGVVLGHKAAEERVEGYATAVLESLPPGGSLSEVEDELFRFMRIVDGATELRLALSSRDVPTAARRSLVTSLLQDRASPATTRLAAYATDIGRPRDYLDLLAYLVDRIASESNRRLAEVRAAVELDDSQHRSLEAVLSRVAGRSVEVRVTVDPSVLGGFVATIGDTVVDGSVRHRLEVLKERLALPEAHIVTGDSADG